MNIVVLIAEHLDLVFHHFSTENSNPETQSHVAPPRDSLLHVSSFSPSRSSFARAMRRRSLICSFAIYHKFFTTTQRCSPRSYTASGCARDTRPWSWESCKQSMSNPVSTCPCSTVARCDPTSFIEHEEACLQSNHMTTSRF